MDRMPPIERFRSKTNTTQSTGYRVYRSEGGSNAGSGSASASTATATPLIMVQGMSAVGTTDWHDLATAMLKHDPKRVVVTFDNRDMGESTWTIDEKSKRFTLQDLAWDVIALAQHLGFKEIDIMGHSMGGMICQTVITTPDLPVRIRHCILGATAAFKPRSDLGTAVATQMKKAAQAAGSKTDSRSKAEKDRELTEVFMRYCYDPQWIKDNPQLYEKRVQESLGTRRPAKTVNAQQHAIGGYDVREKLGKVSRDLPVLVIHGDLDVAVYPEALPDILKGLPHAKVAKCPTTRYGHNWYDYFGLPFWASLLCNFLDDRQDDRLVKAKL